MAARNQMIAKGARAETSKRQGRWMQAENTSAARPVSERRPAARSVWKRRFGSIPLNAVTLVTFVFKKLPSAPRRPASRRLPERLDTCAQRDRDPDLPRYRWR